jgi:hypothetical protein
MTDSLTTSDEVAIAEDYLRQWKILGTGSGSIFPKSSFGGPSSRNYDLFNERTGLFLQHEKQTYGINLGWTDDASSGTAEKVRRWFFARSGGGDGAVKYGETIALANGGDPSFIRNAHRTVGVDLDWSRSTTSTPASASSTSTAPAAATSAGPAARRGVTRSSTAC